METDKTDNANNADNADKTCEGCEKILKELHDIGINCGREIKRLAKFIHPDCIAVIPLYRSCLVIMQSEEENKNGVCTIHAYADPHWLGKDLNIENLKKDEFHFEFKVHGQRSSPELIFKQDDKTVRMSINQGFDFVTIAEKGMDEMFKKLGLYCNSDEDNSK